MNVTYPTIKQEGSIANYQKLFEALTVSLLHLSNDILTSTLMNGLCLVIKVEFIALFHLGLRGSLSQPNWWKIETWNDLKACNTMQKYMGFLTIEC